MSPVPACSGKTTRHRLNRGGDRAANSALHIIAIGRLRTDPRTKSYIAKRIAEGHSSSRPSGASSATSRERSSPSSAKETGDQSGADRHLTNRRASAACNMSRSTIPNDLRMPASSPRSAASATAMTMRSPKPSTACSTKVIHRRGPWRSLQAVEFASLEWVDWFNNRLVLEPIGNIRLPRRKPPTTLSLRQSRWLRRTQTNLRNCVRQIRVKRRRSSTR